MPSLSSLPVELLNIILDFLDQQEDVRVFYSLVVADRKLHSVARPRLYSRFNYDADKHDPASLWKYYQTMQANFDLSQRITHVSFKYRSTLPKMKHKKAPTYHQDVAIVRQAAVSAGLRWSIQEIVSVVRHYNEVPLLVLLLLALPNLRSLHAWVPRRADSYRSMGYLDELIQLATYDWPGWTRTRILAFQRLQYAQIGSAKSPYGNSVEESSITAEGWWRLMFLPRLREFTLLDLDPDHNGCGIEDHDVARTSKVSHLTILHHPQILLSPFLLEWILSAPRTLVSLSLRLHDYLYPGYGVLNPYMHPGVNQELWKQLQQHRDTLEHFDYYRDTRDTQRTKPPCGDAPMHTLRMFEKLRHLCIHPETILGGHYGTQLSPCHLSGALPPSLEHLTLYGGPGMFDITTLHAEIIEVLESESRKLISLTLEDVVIQDYADENSLARKETMFENVAKVCSERGIEFRVLDDGTAWDICQREKPKPRFEATS